MSPATMTKRRRRRRRRRRSEGCPLLLGQRKGGGVRDVPCYYDKEEKEGRGMSPFYSEGRIEGDR